MKEIIQIIIVVAVLAAVAALADGRILTLTVNDSHYRLGVGVGQK
jgi:hypothetical protein